MKKMKKIISLLLAAVMAAGLCSCGEKKAENGIPTLRWLIPGEAQTDSATVMVKVNEMLEKEAGCHLEIQYIDPGIYTERMTMLMASGEPYDLCFTGYVNPYLKAVRGGGLLALDEYLTEDSKLVKSLPDYALQAAKVDGKIHAIPNMQVMANCVGLYFLEDLVNEYGKLNVSEIKSIYEIEPFLEWVKVNHPEKYPFKTGGVGGIIKDYGYNLVAEICKGVHAIEKDGKIVAQSEIELEHRLDEARLVEDYYSKGYIREDISLVTDETSDDKANKFAVWRGTYKPGAEAESAAVKGTGVLAVPVSVPNIPYTAGRTTMTAIGKNSKYPDQAFKVIELMNTNKELFNLVCYGIEGTHYNLVEEQYVEVIEEGGYNPGSSWRFGNQFNALLLPGQDAEVWKQTEEFNNNAEVSKLLGFNFDNTKVRTEVAQIETVFKKYTSFYKGFLPIDSYYEDFKAELKQAGIQTVIDEANAQIQAFLETK